MPAQTLSPDAVGDTAVTLHNAYLELRDPPVPFPPESVAFWSVLLAMQFEAQVKGDCLELGVEHGGTAFLSMLALRSEEQQVLVDLQKTDRFSEQFKKVDDATKNKVSFIKGSTQSADTDHLLEKTWRFIHIDAGHSYGAVKADMQRYACLLGKNGILCCDDFFLNRWPEVTMAILDTYQDAAVVPVALVNRKAYFARVDDADKVRGMIKAVSPALERFGKLNHWDVTLRGAMVDFYQIAPTATVANSPL